MTLDSPALPSKTLLAARLGMEKRSLQFKLSYSVLPLHHLQWLQPAKHVTCDIFRRLTIKWFFFFFLRRLTTKHLKGTHRTDSWAETIWQKLVRQFQVRPTTSSTRTSQLGQQAFTATGCCFSTKSSSLRKSFMKLLFFHGTCHWHSPYSTKFVASSFGRWKKKRNHAVYKDMLLRHMFLYFLNNNGFAEDLWLITEFFFSSNVLLLM